MIGWLRGAIRSREAGRVVVDVGGVGYLVHVPMTTFLELPKDAEEMELFVNTQVRDDAITLFGFRSPTEKEMFERLLGVSGVGPRTALACLSAMGAESLAAALRDGDVRRLSSVPGIGKKTAERMVVDLRDRMGPAAAATAGRGRTAASASGDVVSALVNLGYPERQAARAVGDAMEGKDASTAVFDDLLREALRRLSR